MSKKIISTNSLLQQRPVILRTKSITNHGATGTKGKCLRTDLSEGDSTHGDLIEIPVYYAENETKNEEGKTSDHTQQQQQQHNTPVVIPIIDSSKSKNSKSFYPKDISYTEDGDSISFPLDCEIEGNEEEAGVKMFLGSLNRVVKGPQVFVAKPGASVNIKNVKTHLPGKKTEGEEVLNEHGESSVNDKEGSKYLCKYFLV